MWIEKHSQKEARKMKHSLLKVQCSTDECLPVIAIVQDLNDQYKREKVNGVLVHGGCTSSSKNHVERRDRIASMVE